MTAGGAGGGKGDQLGAVSVLEPGAVSVLEEVLVFGMAPEVEAVREDGVVLGLEDWADDVDEEGRVALAEVLAFGGLTVVGGAGGRAGVPVGGLGTSALTLRVSCGRDWSSK